MSNEDYEDYRADAFISEVGKGSDKLTIAAIAAGGLVWGLSGNMIPGLLVGGCVMLYANREVQNSNRALVQIHKNKMVAPFLEGDRFREFQQQFGDEVCVEQLKQAHEMELEIRPEAENFLTAKCPELFEGKAKKGSLRSRLQQPTQAPEPITKGFSEPVAAQAIAPTTFTEIPAIAPPPIVASAPQPMAVTAAAVEVPVIPEPRPMVAPTITLPVMPALGGLEVCDIASAIASELKPLIITAKPRVGKGIIVAQAWRKAKELNPGLQVWVLQPKPHPTELGYWEGCDRYWGRMLEEYPVNDARLGEEMSRFIAEWRSEPARPKLLIIDEMVKIDSQLPAWYKAQIPSLMKTESSSGETDNRFLWVITQSPLVSDLGLSGGNRAAFEFMAVESQLTSDHTVSIRASYPSIPPIPPDSAIATTPRGTVCYYNRLNKWVAVPTYPNYKVDPLAAYLEKEGAIAPTSETKATPEPQTFGQSEPVETEEATISQTDKYAVKPNLPEDEILDVAQELETWLQGKKSQVDGLKRRDLVNYVYQSWNHHGRCHDRGITRPNVRYYLDILGR